MKFNINNFINTSSQSSKIVDFQDLDHIDGVSISAVSAGLYKFKRDELVLFYFRDGANYASVYTQSKLISENLKWNKKIKAKKIFALLVNTRNANALTGSEGFEALYLPIFFLLISVRLSLENMLKPSSGPDKNIMIPIV